MDKIVTEELLKEHDIKVTANRLIVAKALLEAGRPLGLMELESEIESIDKSGIFRTLMLFKEKHLVHSIEGGSEGARYELCHSHDSERDDDAHVHFFCETCHRTFCLEDIHIPDIDLPEGYLPQSATYVVKGICPECGDNDVK